MAAIIYNGRIYLGRENFCQALIIEGGRIVKTGSSKELLGEMSGAEKTEKIDASGALVLPAFNDSHMHLVSTGQRAGAIECAGAKSIEDVISRGRELINKLKPPLGTYVFGEGVNPDLFSPEKKREPCREDLDKISTEHPVILNRHCRHIMYCNSLALKLAGISESAPEVEGGSIKKDKNGKPTGVLKENAIKLIYKVIPAQSKEERKGFLRLAMKKAHSLGISACSSNDSNGNNFEQILETYTDIYDESQREGLPALRVTMQCGISDKEAALDRMLARGRTTLWEDRHWGTFLKIGSLKLFADGSLGGHTAWMRQPYRDKPKSIGLPVMDESSLNHVVKKAADSSMQVLIHAIGDAALDAVLGVFENVTKPGKNPQRHGIIHCQISSPELLERMARNQILALVQPIFLSDDIHILESRVGPELASTSYAWASMQRLGVPVTYSTDAPISPLDPLLNIQWAVLHHNPGERVDVYSAVDAYTTVSAFSCFDEASLGRITPGYLADMVFLDRDIFTIPPEDIHKTRVLRTICAGKTVYQST